MKTQTLIFFLLFFSFSAYAGSAVLVDDIDVAAKPSLKKSSQRSSLEKNIKSELNPQSFSSAMELRARRRAAVGLLTLGQVGLAGADIELNFTASNSFVGQFGGGNRYNSLSFQWKHVFGGISFTPYTTVGYARWYNSNASRGPITSSTPTILASRFLNDEEKNSGQFAKDIFVPSVGFQYYQLSGEFVGSSIYVEVVFLTALSTSISPVPTGAAGFLYYF